MSDKANILIVDDELGPRESLKMVLKPYYTIYTAESGEQALEIIRKHSIDLVTLDLKMPRMSGIETLREIKKITEDVEVIILTGFGSLKTAMEGIRYGAADYLLKPFDIAELVSIVNRTLERKTINDRLKRFINTLRKLINVQSDYENVKKILQEPMNLTEKIRAIFERSLLNENIQPEQRPLVFAKSLVEIMEGESYYLPSHSKRVAQYSHLMAEQLQLSPKQLMDLELGTYLHDIGSLGIYRNFYDRESHESQNGGEGYRRHPDIGSELIAPLGFSPDVIYIIRHHHEQYDGSGFPGGLKGEEIPFLARIVAVAEAFDDMIGHGVGRESMSPKDIVAELNQGSGIRFDPKLVEILIRIIKEKQEVLLPKFIVSKVEV